MEQIILHSDDVNCCYASAGHLHYQDKNMWFAEGRAGA